jgi:hypothetical protein
MNWLGRVGFAGLIVFALSGCGQRADRRATVAPNILPAAPPIKRAPPIARTPEVRGYENSLNRLVERRLEVKDDQGKPAVRDFNGATFQELELTIVWALASQYNWNYTVPELHGGKNPLETEYPSEPLFLEKKLGAKSYLSVSVPDTPYGFYILDGQVSPHFIDTEKAVIWHVKSAELERAFHEMRTISASSKRIVFSAPGGDMAASLAVDFSDRENSPKVSYHKRYDGP